MTQRRISAAQSRRWRQCVHSGRYRGVRWNTLPRVKAAILTALSVPFVLAAPQPAQAQPNLNPTPDEMCNTTQTIVNTVHSYHPEASTPEQVATVYDQLMTAKVPGYGLFQGTQHQQLLELIHACGIPTDTQPADAPDAPAPDGPSEA